MKTLSFVGYSDDTFACTGPGIDVDRDNCASGEPIRFAIDATEGGLVVSSQYSPAGCGGWLIGIAPPDATNEEHIPEWPIRFKRSDREYSPVMEIDAPDDVQVYLLDDYGKRLFRRRKDD